ncbi:MAG: MqnA/MqnD/SBP family protein [Anaerovoracaceae bacterium]
MKKNISKIIVPLLVIVLIVTLFGCNKASDVSSTINIATLKGPTGLGMVQLMDNTDKYNVTTYESPDEITSKILNGDVDIAAIPSNMAAVLYNKTGGKIVAISPNTLGILYLTENKTNKVSSFKDINKQTIFASGKGSSPEFIMKALFESAGINFDTLNIKWLSNHSDVVAAHMKNPSSLALIPEPFLTVASSKNPNIKVAIDLNNQWKTLTEQDLPMGVLVAQKSFANERKEDLSIFMNDYRDSVDFVNNDQKEAAKLIVKNKIIADVNVAQKSIKRCNIVLFDSQESQATLSTFYDTLSKIDKKSIGGIVPKEDFYYHF